MSAWRFWQFCLLALCWSFVRPAVGQGYVPSSRSTTLGSTSTYLQLRQLYQGSKSYKQAYKLSPAASCSKSSTTSLCAAAGSEALSSYAQLMLATSPQVYSSTDARQVGPVRLVSASGDQGDCSTCTAFAVVSAAETAMASVLRVPVQRCSISVQALYFCPATGPVRSCEAGWTLPEALAQLEQRSSSLPTAACLPYKPDYKSELSRSELCEGVCSAPNEFANQGWFTSVQVTSAWQAQRHIRQYGAVVTRFDVYTDLKDFFEDFGNADQIYRPGPNAKLQFGHAVALIGYNNDQQYWLVKNSYGPDWGNGGLFKVAYDVCGVLSEAFGVIWEPKTPPAALQLQVVPASNRPGCYLYKAGPLDYLSRIAWIASIPLDQFMLDNTGIVKDLDAPLTGLQLLLCKPKPGRFVVAGSGTPAAAAPAPVPVQAPIVPPAATKPAAPATIIAPPATAPAPVVAEDATTAPALDPAPDYAPAPIPKASQPVAAPRPIIAAGGGSSSESAGGLNQAAAAFYQRCVGICTENNNKICQQETLATGKCCCAGNVLGGCWIDGGWRVC